MRAFPNGETVTLQVCDVTAKDADGNDVRSYTPVVVKGCAVWPRAGSEAVQSQTLITDNLTIVVPNPVEVGPLDRVTRGAATYRQTSPPNVYRSPLTGHRGGTELTLERVTG